jgi:hypothetical protein
MRSFFATAFASGTVLLLMSGNAAADEPRATSEPPSYAWQILAADGLALAFSATVYATSPPAQTKVGSGGSADHGPSDTPWYAPGGPPLYFILSQPGVLRWAALGTYALSAPAIHLSHGRPGVAALSFGLRAGVPLLVVGATLATTSALCSSQSDGPAVCSAIVDWLGAFAMAAAYVGVVAYDAARLARPATLRPSCVPSVQAVRGGAVLGFEGVL